MRSSVKLFKKMMCLTSVIIPTFNAGAKLNKVLDALDTQTLKAEEILIVDSNSNDTTKIAQNHSCKVIKINKQDFDHGTTRNFGVAQTNSEFVVFLTQDAIPANEYMIAELIKPMWMNPNIALCYGRQIARANARPLERFFREFNYPPQAILKTKHDISVLGLKTFYCSNCCSAIRRSIFNKLGGFKNNVIVNEDMLFAAKAIMAGYDVYYTPEAQVYHSHSYSLPQIYKRYFKIGRFFADNKWLLRYGGIKHYGGNIVKSGIATFWKEKKPHCIVALLAELAVKTIAYKLGWYHQLLFHKKKI
jgi:rhamnosyltransferase